MKLLSHNLQAFLQVVRSGTVHGAARELRLSQAATTHRIASLEEELGLSLFLRSRKGMTLTPEGQRILRYCQQAIEMEGDALTGGGPSRLGASPAVRVSMAGPSSVIRSRIIPAVAPVMERNPHLAVTFNLSDTGSPAQLLKQGAADLVLLERKDVALEFDSKLLSPEQYVLVTPLSWARRALKDIVEKERIIDFDPSDEMTHRWLAKFGYQGLARQDRHFANNTDALAWLVSLGTGYSVLAKDFAESISASAPIAIHGRNKTYEYEIALAWYPRPHKPDWLKTLLGVIR